MIYLLDTKICIYIIKQKPTAVAQRFDLLEPGSMGISLVTYGELLTGASKSRQAAKSRAILQELMEYIPVLTMDGQAAEHYADIRASLEQEGTPIGNNDLWIAAHARSEGLVLVSNNLREFERVEGLQLENWV